jgi:epoxyqueuosine reductase
MDDFSSWLQDTARAAGAVDAAVLLREQLSGARPAGAFAAWAASENAGRLHYIDRSAHMRQDPFGFRPWARNAVVVLFTAGWCEPALSEPDLPSPQSKGPYGVISRYVGATDYHTVGRQILAKLAAGLQAEYGSNIQTEVSVDTGAVPEVFLADRAGLGTVGFNRLLRTSHHGSRVFVGVLFTSVPLPTVRAKSVLPAQPCADCRSCLTRCPGHALSENLPVALARCRSYLTIEYRGVLNAEQQQLLGHSLFGCDICTATCPPEEEGEGQRVDLEWLLTVPAADIRRRIAGTALERAGVTLLRRNATVILARKYTADSRPLLARFAGVTASPLLKAQLQAFNN